MLKLVSAVVVSVVLSLSLSLGFTSWHQTVSSDFTSIRQATHKLLVTDEQGIPFGTCSSVQIAPHHVLTAAHCTPDGAKLLINGKEAIVIKKDPKVDLSLLWVDQGCPCVPIAHNTPKLDSKVYTVGYPLNLGEFVTDGRMQGLVTFKDYTHYMLLSTPVIFGNSGGGAFQFQGGQWVLVGITSAMASGAIGGMFPFVVPHMAIMVNTDTLNRFTSVGQ